MQFTTIVAILSASTTLLSGVSAAPMPQTGVGIVSDITAGEQAGWWNIPSYIKTAAQGRWNPLANWGQDQCAKTNYVAAALRYELGKCEDGYGPQQNPNGL